MLEVYVILTLAGIGYLLNQTSYADKSKGDTKLTLSKNENPSMDNVYNSTYANETLRVTGQKANKMYNLANDPRKNAVISQNYNFLKENKEDLQKEQILSLSGKYIDKENFKHNNQIPFFGGSIKQSVESFANDSIMLSRNGTDYLYKQKSEVKSFYDKCQNVGNVNGSANQTNYIKERITESRIKNNVFPVPQVQVGPGLNKGFTAEPTGGYQQFDTRDYAMPKTVDDLRAANKPKETFKGVTLDGIKYKMRGDIGNVAKNKPERFWEQTQDMLFGNKGITKQMDIPNQLVKDTNRQDIQGDYMGPAYGHDQQERTRDSAVHVPRKPQFGEFGFTNPTGTNYGKGDQDDHGKSTIFVYNNERDITTTKVYQGNITSLIKSIIAPVEDMIKVTKKEEFIDNPRHFANMSIQIPAKQTIKDPNDVAKVTIKETLIHDGTINNLAGPKKLAVYDPNDVAKVTINETLIHDGTINNLTGPKKLAVYDPNDVAKVTINETLIHDGTINNLTGHKQLTLYDPNDVAKVTIKETLIHDGTINNLAGPKQLAVYDPDDIAKVTLRQTMSDVETTLNLAGKSKVQTYNNDPSKTTLKETTIDNERIGNTDRFTGGLGGNAYETTEFDARNTQKQFLSDNDHYGQVGRDKGLGYETNEYDARNTQKQFLSDNDYFGTAASAIDKKQVVYDTMYNAHITPNKEVTLVGRDPTQTGSKDFVGKEGYDNMVHHKIEADYKSAREMPNTNRLYNEIPSVNEIDPTKMKKMYEQPSNQRLDINILKSTLDNPLNIDLASHL